MPGSSASPLISEIHKAVRNQNGGLYIRGATYDILTKLRVADAYEATSREGVNVNISGLAESCGVSNKFVNKVVTELREME